MLEGAEEENNREELKMDLPCDSSSAASRIGTLRLRRPSAKIPPLKIASLMGKAGLGKTLDNPGILIYKN